ncbi:aminoglycoside phosphotransferase family protein [Oceanobacillus jeddahense]|uniref:aminoglycoside phosphotransferase family protein n=1 Tax=Oceanobacillus jeddahense TaxID=1462527 RepID=UPI000595F7BF|nr:aminoglycoside phosphotransferase family protein [Oceanobacillus jeddahense]
MNKFTAILQTEYDVHPIHIQPKQGGWASLAFEVKENGTIYFLKAYEKSRASTPKLTAMIDQYVPIVAWLEHNSCLKGKVPVPLKTREGNYKCEDEENIYLLYPFIQGQTIGEKDLTEQQVEAFAHMIATLHLFGEEIPFPTEALTENFEVSFVRELEEIMHDKTEQISAEWYSFMHKNREKIGTWINAIKELSEKLHTASLDKVLCHTDLHHWNLMQADNLLLIDWEGLKLAPAEADIMFLTDKPYLKHFIKVYQQYHKNYHINEDALVFYQLRRRLEDIWEFAGQLLYEELDIQEKDSIIGYLKDLTDDENDPLEIAGLNML